MVLYKTISKKKSVGGELTKVKPKIVKISSVRRSKKLINLKKNKKNRRNPEITIK